MSVSLDAFSDELRKIAYGEKTHKHLGQSTGAAFSPKAKPRPVVPAPQAQGRSVGSLVTQGSVGADRGIRHPFLPNNPSIHSFAGNTKKQLGQNVLAQQNRAVDDIVRAVGRVGSRAPVRGARGALELGQMSHSLSDIASHYEKPLAARKAGKRVPVLSGLAERVRSGSQRYGLGGITGPMLGGLEHIEGDIAGTNIDAFDPKKSRIDAIAQRRAEGAGRAARRKVVKRLGLEYGMSPVQAEAAIDRLMSARAPRTAELAARASRDARYLGGQARQPLRLAARALRFLR